MRGDQIRDTFLRFFKERDHTIVPSSSLIPDDPNLLLTNAGMNQFKPYFLGLGEPPYPRAASVQKVFRTSDLENVGHTSRHLTFFEMLGNFSFGDYFKTEACAWAHELVTQGYGIDPDRLWVTVFETDDDAVGVWADHVGIPPERIVRRGREDNFWWMHVAGPCGPCSEIYVDRGPAFGPDGGPAVDEERYLEIWNIVFMQSECDEQGTVQGDLPKRNIDTGSSLERVAMLLQDAPTFYETDLMRPLVEVAESLSGRTYGKDPGDDLSLRILAEHGRACSFLIADGVLPSNEGRGYVLRRMLRRVVTHARKLGVDRPVMGDLARTTIRLLGDAYPELRSNEPFILQVASSEEEHFGTTYRQGISLFEADASAARRRGSTVFPGTAAFKLHDTFGFPLESTVELAAEQELAVDTEEFHRLMEQQRRRAREAVRKADVAEPALAEIAQLAGPSEFLGYEKLSADARLVGLVSDGSRREAAEKGQSVRIVLDRTPFYAEAGGQVGDAGVIAAGAGVVEVTDTVPGPGGTTVHRGVVSTGEIHQGEDVEARVDGERREATARSHTATHVLHHTLRAFLGEHARQAGSLVAPGRLRFDFTHFEAVPRDALEEIEYRANGRLAVDSPVRAYETTFDFARSQGAIALFGEKYGDLVRVVEVGDYSVELCGGTHVRHTGEVALLRLVSEASIGAGFRRIEALTGPDALRQVNLERRLLEEVAEVVGGGDAAHAPERVRQVVARIKQLESELGKIRKAERQQQVERLASQTLDVGGVQLVVAQLDGQSAEELRELALALRNTLERKGHGAAVLGTAGDGKALMVAACTEQLIARGVTAQGILEQAAKAIGGGAGGKPGLAFAGGPNAAALPDALTGIAERLSALLGG
jgi:alanyl-tRNA synthetase